MSNDLRELVAMNLTGEWNTCLEEASDVISALTDAGALMPELPDPQPRWASVDIVMSIPENKGKCVGRIIKRKGSGATIPAAIANALEGDAK